MDVEQLIEHMLPPSSKARWLAQDQDGQWWYYIDNGETPPTFKKMSPNNGYRWYGGLAGPTNVVMSPVSEEHARNSLIDLNKIREAHNDAVRDILSVVHHAGTISGTAIGTVHDSVAFTLADNSK